MIEAYAFLGMFIVQILAGSILFPERMIRRVRSWTKDSASERFRQLYPQSDVEESIRRLVTFFRAANIVTAVLGFLMLGWFYTQVRQPDSMGELKMPLVGYTLVQFAPLVLLALYGVARGFKSFFPRSQEARRTATLQRRGLFDFVSPFAAGLAVLTYAGFIGFAIFLDLEVYDNASLSRQFWIALAAVTAIYALNSFVIYKYLYGRRNPLQTHRGRVHSIAVNVKGSVYSCIAAAWFFSFLGVVGQPHLKGWLPFTLSFFLSVTWVIILRGMSAPPPEAEKLDAGSSEMSS